MGTERKIAFKGGEIRDLRPVPLTKNDWSFLFSDGEGHGQFYPHELIDKFPNYAATDKAIVEAANAEYLARQVIGQTQSNFVVEEMTVRNATEQGLLPRILIIRLPDYRTQGN